jgi:hypothetical protein
MAQYQREERALIATRLKSSPNEIADILDSMERDNLSTPENTYTLKHELARHYKNDKFIKCQNMGGILRLSLNLVLRK